MRLSPAIQPKTQRHVEDRFREFAVPVLKTRLYDREALQPQHNAVTTLRELSWP
jgi:hypothetical protein